MVTVRELQEKLEELIDDGRGDDEIRLTYQSNYPLQSHVRGVWAPDDSEESEELDLRDSERNVVWVVSDGQVRETPYGHGEAWDDTLDWI